MTNLLVMREYIKNFYSKYEEYVLPALKLVLGLIVFGVINGKLGYLQKLDNFAVVLIAALFCSFLPTGVMIFLAGVFILLHLFSLSLECSVILLLLFVLVVLCYFRFEPNSGVLLLLTPLSFLVGIPYVMPIAAGLLFAPMAAVPVAFGAVIYYVLSYITANETMFGGGEASAMLQRSKDMVEGLTGNKEMLIVAAAFAVTAILVYAIRRMSVDYSWTIAILVGALADIVILLVGDLMYDANFSIAGVIIGSMISIFLAFILQLGFFNLDYARTEKVQFEDDDYYYYVKAVPKMSVSTPAKKVKRITTPRMNQSMNRAHGKTKTRTRK